MAKKRDRSNPTCYFQCEDCGAVTTAPTSDVKHVGHPVCPDECGNEEMTEITYNEYRKAKAEIDAKPFRDVNGERYSGDLKYYQPHEPDGVLVDKDGKEWPSFAVWINRDTCAALFPNYEKIDEFTGAEIEEPLFVDKPEE